MFAQAPPKLHSRSYFFSISPSSSLIFSSPNTLYIKNPVQESQGGAQGAAAGQVLRELHHHRLVGIKIWQANNLVGWRFVYIYSSAYVINDLLIQIEEEEERKMKLNSLHILRELLLLAGVTNGEWVELGWLPNWYWLSTTPDWKRLVGHAAGSRKHRDTCKQNVCLFLDKCQKKKKHLFVWWQKILHS